MSYTYLLEQGEESSAECFSDIPESVLSSLSLTAEKSCCSGSETDACQSSQFGTTCEHSTESRGGDVLTLCAEASRAKTLAARERERALRASNLGCGGKCPEWFAKFNPNTYLWKIRQCFMFEDLEDPLSNWPKWGIMQDGECWEPMTPVFATTVKECGFLTTPSGTSNHGNNHVSGRLDEWGPGSNPFRGTPIGKLHCPRFEEWMMGWPDRWTEMTPYETAKFQQWLESHGKH